MMLAIRIHAVCELAGAAADGAEVISDFRVVGDQEDLFGLIAAVNAARRRVWAAAAARHGALPGIRFADKMLAGVTCIRLDASVVTCHSPALGTRS